MPVITLEVLSDASQFDSVITENTEDLESNPEDNHSGLHFLSQKQNETADDEDASKPRHELLEYVIRHDGSVLCKFCGEVLKNRKLWYRHKYKLHVMPLNPSPLFQCEHCLVYFKSKKGYIGHLASRHGDIITEASPVLSNSQSEANKEKTSLPTVQSPRAEKQKTDLEPATPKVTNINSSNVVKTLTKCNNEGKKTAKIKAERPNEEKRSRDEKLVADIISRVRKECEAQGYGGPTRRGYSRRTTVMHST